MKNFKKLVITILVFAICFSGTGFNSSIVQAAPFVHYELSYEGTPTKVGAYTYTQKYSSNYTYQITIKKCSKKVKVINNVTGPVIVTNKNMLYYTLRGSEVKNALYGSSWNNTIYQYTPPSNTLKKLVSGKDYALVNINSPHLYYAQIESAGEGFLYAKNLKTGKITQMFDYGLYHVDIGDKRICVRGEGGDYYNSWLYAYNFDGTNRTYIAEGIYAVNIKNYIYYVEMKYGKVSDVYYRIGRTDLNGKNKKLLTKFQKSKIVTNEQLYKNIIKTIK